MEERKEEGEAEIQEHGPEHWFSKWERQCLAEAEQDEQLSPELQEEAAAAAQPEHKQQKLWHLFQNSATAVAQLYKGEVRGRHLAAAAASPSPPWGRRVSREPRGWSPTRPQGPAIEPPPPPPRRPLPTRWRRGGGPGGRPRPSWGPARGSPPFGTALGGPPAAGARLPAPPGREGRGGAPGHKMAKGGGGAGPLCPESASGRRLGGGASLGRRRLGAAPLGPAARRGPRRDPLPSVLALEYGILKPWNKMAKPNMAVPE